MRDKNSLHTNTAINTRFNRVMALAYIPEVELSSSAFEIHIVRDHDKGAYRSTC